MKFRKKIMMKSLGILFASSLIAAPVFACTTSTNQSTNIDQNPPSDNIGGDNSGNNGDTGQNGGSDNNQDKNEPINPSTVDENVNEASNFDVSKYASNTTNEAGLTQNANDFLATGDFSQFKGTKTEINKDALLFFYNLSQQYNNLTITNSNVVNQPISEQTPATYTTTGEESDNTVDTTNDVIFNQTKISFDMTASIKSGVDQTIIIGSKQVELKKDETYNIKIDVKDQVIKPALSTYNKENYLSWKVDGANFALNNEEWSETNYSFNNGMPSHTFKYKIQNISNGVTYFDLKNKYESSAYNVDSQQIKNDITTYVDNSFLTNIKYVDYATGILNVLREDKSVPYMLQHLSPILVNILVDTKLVPENLKDFLLESLYGKEQNGQLSEVPFINAFDEHKEEVAYFVGSLLGLSQEDIEGQIIPILGMIHSNMTEEEFSSLETLLNMFLPSLVPNWTPELGQQIFTFLKGDLLGIGTPAKSLANILFDNYKTIFGLVKPLLGGSVNENVVNGIEQLLEILLAKKDGGQYVSVYDAVFASKESKQAFYNAIKNFVSISPQIDEFIQLLVIDNDTLTKNNILNVIIALSDFMNNFFATNPDATSIETRYLNLEFTRTVNKEPVLDKNNKTISFDYQYTFSLKKQVTLNIAPIKELISDEAFDKILKQLISTQPGASWINTAIKFLGGTKGIKVALFKLIPDKIIFGKDDGTGKASPNKLTFKFSANNNKTWFKPIRNGNVYNNGFEFTYNMNIKHDDPSFIESITSNYQNTKEVGYSGGVLKLNMNYSDFWRSVIKNILVRDYDVTLTNTIKTDEEISSASNYDDSQVYGNYQFENKTKDADNGQYIWKNVSISDTNNFVTVNSEIAPDGKLQWKNEKTKEALQGSKPIYTEEKYELVKNKLFSFSEDFSNYSLNITPIFNMELPISLEVAIVNKRLKFDIMLTNVNLYFPFKVLDKTTNKAVDSVATSISYFNFSM